VVKHGANLDQDARCDHQSKRLFGAPSGSGSVPKTSAICIQTLAKLIAHLEAKGMPTSARGVRHEHVERYFAEQREEVATATLSIGTGSCSSSSSGRPTKTR